MKITSSEFARGGMIPTKYTCQGDDVNPSLYISDVPNSAKSMALIVHDHDAPGGDFVHWLVWNIDPKIKEIDTGTVPFMSHEGQNDFGKIGWGGPCPPSGKHHYDFHLYALDAMLDLPDGTGKEHLRSKIQEHILEAASVIGTYQKI